MATTRSKIKTWALSVAFKKISVEILSNTYSGCTTRKLVNKKSHGNLEQRNVRIFFYQNSYKRTIDLIVAAADLLHYMAFTSSRKGCSRARTHTATHTHTHTHTHTQLYSENSNKIPFLLLYLNCVSSLKRTGGGKLIMNLKTVKKANSVKAMKLSGQETLRL